MFKAVVEEARNVRGVFGLLGHHGEARRLRARHAHAVQAVGLRELKLQALIRQPAGTLITRKTEDEASLALHVAYHYQVVRYVLVQHCTFSEMRSSSC